MVQQVVVDRYRGVELATMMIWKQDDSPDKARKNALIFLCRYFLKSDCFQNMCCFCFHLESFPVTEMKTPYWIMLCSVCSEIIFWNNRVLQRLKLSSMMKGDKIDCEPPTDRGQISRTLQGVRCILSAK
nr:uncharacterized protein LOC105747476 isoform X3 [Dasypus novemcinctus]